MLKKVLAAAVTLGLATGAQAYEPEFPGYIQGSLGQAKAKKPSVVKDTRNSWSENEPGASIRTSSDRTDTAYKLIFGVQVHEFIALEGQYIDLGKSKYKVRVSEGNRTAQDKLDFKETLNKTATFSVSA